MKIKYLIRKFDNNHRNTLVYYVYFVFEVFIKTHQYNKCLFSKTVKYSLILLLKSRNVQRDHAKGLKLH